MHHSESVVARLRRLASRTLTRAGTLALRAGSPANRPLRTCQALKRLNPEAEAGCPDKSRATCRTALLSGAGRGGRCLYQRCHCRPAHLHRSPQ